jgi:glycosyltransferase involved in cell wall biosynthesis
MGLKISVVTATLNRSDFLPRCIEGVARQSYPNKEHLIIDGGSTDGTIDLLKSYAGQYSHVRWISEKDNGISSALNKGLALASGDVIGVNGDDDFYLPGTFEIVAREFEQNPSVGLVAGHCDCIGNDERVVATSKASFTTRRDLIQHWKTWGTTTFLPAPSTFFRREVIAAVGGFDDADKCAMDYHHWIKITEKFQVKIVDRVLARFRYDEGTVTFSNSQKQWEETHSISRKYWGSRTSLEFYRMAFSYFNYQRVTPAVERVRNSLKYRLGRLFREPH